MVNPHKSLSIIILSKDKPELILPLIDQLKEAVLNPISNSWKVDVLLGDTGSTDLRVLESYGNLPSFVRLTKGLTYHFSKNNNHLSKHTNSEYLLFLNNDIFFHSPYVSLKLLCDDLLKIAPFEILGAQLLYPDERVQHVGIQFSRNRATWALPYHFAAGEKRIPQASVAPAVTGAFLAIRRRDFEMIGGFEEFYEVECQDVDLCLKVHRLGSTSRVLDLGKITHFENGTRPPGDVHVPDRETFLRRWRVYIEENFLYDPHSTPRHAAESTKVGDS